MCMQVCNKEVHYRVNSVIRKGSGFAAYDKAEEDERGANKILRGCNFLTEFSSFSLSWTQVPF